MAGVAIQATAARKRQHFTVVLRCQDFLMRDTLG
jgi:hypothetical protein